jgi:hypothetical protein
MPCQSADLQCVLSLVALWEMEAIATAQQKVLAQLKASTPTGDERMAIRRHFEDTDHDLNDRELCELVYVPILGLVHRVKDNAAEVQYPGTLPVLVCCPGLDAGKLRALRETEGLIEQAHALSFGAPEALFMHDSVVVLPHSLFEQYMCNLIPEIPWGQELFAAVAANMKDRILQKIGLPR